jgi:hypothetical protein
MTQRYCAWDLASWDPKVTTFPGLYVLGAAYAQLSSLLLARVTSGGGLVRPSQPGRTCVLCCALATSSSST